MPQVVLATLVLTAGVLRAGPGTPAAAAEVCSTTSTAAEANQTADHRPAIFVHGWTANGSALTGAAKELTRRTGGAITPFFFDYGQDSTTWAAAAVVQGCLAQYIKDVSTTYSHAGGDGKVLLVGHSMGGVATLYASAGQGVSADIGGVVTFDTPYLGSPFGGTSLGADFQGAQEVLGSIRAAPAGSNAQQCLALHQDAAPLPAPCIAGLPPYLARTTRLTEIAGQVTVKRTFAGIHLYDISLDSDGIVGTSSSHGYLQIEKKNKWPYGQPMELQTDPCTITSDNLQTAAVAARWSKSALLGLLAGLGQVAADNNALDGALAGKLTPGLVMYLGAATLAAPCSHIHVYQDPTALDQAARALNADVTALNAHDPLTYQDLRSAPVPPLCNFTAGNLVNGTLVGHTESRGEPPTLGLASGVALGDLNGDRVGDAAGVVSCNAGGVSWPDNIVFWARGASGHPIVLGSYQMGDAVGDARDGTQKITYLSDGSVQVTSLDARKFDAGCCASGRATVTLKWDGHKVVASRIEHLPGPNDVTFTGIGAVKLGMSAADLSRLGFTATPGYQGCLNYASTDGQLYVTYNPQAGKVVRINPSPSASSSYRTTDGLGTGQFISDVSRDYPGKTIEDHEDGSFGQGSSGMLVGDGSGGWISYFDDGGGVVASLEVSDHKHYGALEAGCQ
ncbi:MAG: hypothetical protein JWO67_6782 [Streptosporangiaceae bacterium]|nr:hypothetical protein [Streptosporangiaceae bacterium]